ncbi:MAG: phytanoyl-CoA dioxygenase family protein [Chloroflexota bacterium]
MEKTNQQQIPPELENLLVYGETSVGWDEHTLPNETVDEDGYLLESNRGFGVPDPRAPKRRVYNDPSVEELREHLRRHNGIHGLEICTPSEIERAARIFHRDGFVVVRDLLNPKQLARFREGASQRLKEILAIPGPENRKYMVETKRLPHRYSYGTSSASRQMLHDPIWASMIDLPTTTPILTEIFGTAEYGVWGAGGDLALPGAIEYQHLHSDGRDAQLILDGRAEQAKHFDIEINPNSTGGVDLPALKLMMEMTAPMVTINFLMSDLTWENGPIRQIPGTHVVQQLPPKPEDEPDWMRLSTLVGAPAGAGVFRDNRAWHGATPNLSKEIRAMPNVEYVAPWFPIERLRKTMPYEIWETLTPHAQRLCINVRADKGVWPAGAGIMHPLINKKKELSEGFYVR